MSTSDFLLILSILVTLITVSIANNKKLWLYKFSNWSIFIGILWGFFINYLVFYEKLPSVLQPSFMEFDNGLRPDYWAYIIAVLGLLLLMFYIAKCKYFPRKNWDKIVNYYRDLITENPVLLIAAIEKYHLKNMEQSIKRINNDSKEEPSPYENENWEKQSSPRRYSASLSAMVWTEVVFTEEFVSQCAKVRPLFLLRFFSQYQGNNIPNGKEMIQLFFKEFIKSKNTVFIRELEEFFNHENEPIINQAEKMTFFKYIFQKDFLWLTKYEIVRAIGEEAEKEIATEWASFAKKTNEWDNEKYQRTISYQCLRLYALQYMYLSEFWTQHPDYKKDEIDCREWLPFSHTLTYICKAIHSQTAKIESGIYADKFIDNCREVIYDVLGYIGKYCSADYVSSLVQCNLDITRDVNKDNPICIPKDSTIVAMEQYIRLVEYQNIDNEVQKEYLDFLMKKKMNMTYWKEALDEVGKKYGEKGSFTQLKQLFTQNEK